MIFYWILTAITVGSLVFLMIIKIDIENHCPLMKHGIFLKKPRISIEFQNLLHFRVPSEILIHYHVSYHFFGMFKSFCKNPSLIILYAGDFSFVRILV